MRELYTRWCEECKFDRLHRYLDCEECKEKEQTCIDICTVCGTEVVINIKEEDAEDK